MTDTYSHRRDGACRVDVRTYTRGGSGEAHVAVMGPRNIMGLWRLALAFELSESTTRSERCASLVCTFERPYAMITVHT